MKYIADMVYNVKEELEDAKEYAEKSVYYKAQGNLNKSKLFNDMAQDELKHSKIVHDLLVEEITRTKDVLKPTAEMLKMWEEAHNEYVDNFAWVKQMLSI